MPEPIRNPKSREIQPERKDAALSIPERAREIAEREAKKLYEKYEYVFQARTAKMKLYNDIRETVKSAMEDAAKLLREGGQK